MKFSNERLEIIVSEYGAELLSLRDIKHNIEYLWQRDSGWWEKTSPILFPYIGFNYNSEVKINGVVYSTSKHGFARERDFLCEVVNNKLICVYESVDRDLETFPYPFKLKVIYELVDNKLIVSYEVFNLSDETMFFELGGHPAFNFKNGDKVTLVGDDNKRRFVLDGPYVGEIYKESVESFLLKDELFENDALIYDGVKHVIIESDKRRIRVVLEDFEFVGIWSMYKGGKMAPFICVEPWAGLPDKIGYDGEIKDKLGIQSIDRNKSRVYRFEVILG